MKVRRKAPLPEPVPGKPLTRANLASHYGAESKDLDAVEKALNSFGLTTLSKNAAARTVKLAGAASKMERAFKVNLLRVKHNDILYRGRVGEIQIPAQLAKIVTGVFGLDNRPMIKRRRPIRSQGVQALPSPDQRPGSCRKSSPKRMHFPTATAMARRSASSSSAASTSRKTSSNS